MKDWTKDASILNTNLRSAQAEKHDYYATDPAAVEALLEREYFSHWIWEPACGGGHISEILRQHGFYVRSTDIVDRGYVHQSGCINFLESMERDPFDIITNPPYKYAAEFAEHALDLAVHNGEVAMFLKLTFLEGAKRKALFDKYPPRIIYIFRNRIDCWKNGIEPEKPPKAVCYAWFVWEKGYTGRPAIDWIDLEDL